MAQIGAEWVLYVLLVLSLVSVALIIERIIYFVRHRQDVDTLRRRLRTSLEQGGPALALKRFEEGDGAELAVLREALAMADGGAGAVEEIAAGARGQEKLKLERGLIFLGTLGNNAPFIGLFGTVLGIINAFRDLSQTDMAKAGAGIMGSISEALVATAVGLLLAIPAVIAFNIFQRQVKRVLAQADSLLHDLLAYLRKREADAELFFAAPIQAEPARPTHTAQQTPQPGLGAGRGVPHGR